MAGVGQDIRRRLLAELAVELVLAEEDRAALAHEHVGSCAFDVVGGDERLAHGVDAGGGPGIQVRLAADLAGLRIEAIEPDSAVEKGRTPGRAIGDAVDHQDAAVDPPRRFELAEGDDPPLGRRRAEPPGQLPVAGPDAIHIAVGGAEEHPFPVHGGRRIDAAAGGKLPQRAAVGDGERVERVLVLSGHVDARAADNRRGEPAANCGGPAQRHLGRHVATGRACPGGVVTIGRPIG